MKYPILVLGAAFALIAAAPQVPTPPPPPPALPSATPSAAASAEPTASPSSEYNASPVYTAAPAPSASGSPAASPSPSLDTMMGGHDGHGGGHRPNAGGTPPPPVDVRKGLDGVWEVQIQRGDNTEYDHFNIKQTGTSLTGTYLTKDNKRYPVAGSLDGTNVRIVVSLPDGSTILLEARVDGTTDMLGMFTDAKERVPFTAAYRPKEKWIENVNATPGGLGGPGGPGGGGQPPR